MPFGTIGVMRGRLRAGAIGAVLLFASVALPAPVASAGVNGEPTFSVGLGSGVTFRHYGDYLYVTDMKADGQCAVGLISQDFAPDLPQFSRDVEVVLNCEGKGTTVRKSFAHIPEGRIIRYYACTTSGPYYNYYDYCGAQVWAQA